MPGGSGSAESCSVGSEAWTLRRISLQSKYWRCLKPFVERLSFDPYASPFAETAAGASPRAAVRSGSLTGHGSGEVSSPRAAASQSQLLLPKGGLALPPRHQDVSRVIRSKFVARHQV